MSELIRRMQEQWAINEHAHEDARRRAIWAEVGKPREAGYRAGYELARRLEKNEPIADPVSAALAEGFMDGLRDFMGLGWKDSWRFSKARLDALAAAEGRANG